MSKLLKSTRKSQFMIPLISVVLLFFVILAESTNSTPPEYKTFRRDQLVNYSPEQNDLMRIWIVYIGQGDGILIQLPTKYNYNTTLDDNSDDNSERIDIMIDGGSHSQANETLMLNFLKSLYHQLPITIEHNVITHHDSDHVRGFTKILEDPNIGIQYIYHNGLASYVLKEEFLENIGSTTKAIRTETRFMARYDNESKILNDADLISGLDELRTRHNNNDFQGIYKNLAKAVVEKEAPQNVSEFNRVWEGQRFVKEVENSIGRNLTDLELQVIWPQQNLKAYQGDWGKTINGNSVTFRIKYHNFEMLFTGDHNEYSEEALITHLKNNNNEHLLDCDVLKVCHHGSKHNLKEFFKSNGSRYVLCLASMGHQGFFTNWQHPSTDVIKWAGGAHRFYSTYIHERKFKWSDMDNEEKQNAMLELKHILIETDGNWFRLVEVDINGSNLNAPPTVQQTRRGNGTRWIKAN